MKRTYTECARNPLTEQQLLLPSRDRVFEPRRRLYAYPYDKPANSFPGMSSRIPENATATLRVTETEPKHARWRKLAFNPGGGGGLSYRASQLEIVVVLISLSSKSGNFWRDAKVERNRGRSSLARVTFGSFLRARE